jgi:hypothetical protein
MSEALCVPKVGQLLWRGCSCDNFGRVTRVGKDLAGREVIDIELVAADINELYFPKSQTEVPEWEDPLTQIKLPPGTKVEITDVLYKADSPEHIYCCISTGGCYRCTESFWPHDEWVEASTGKPLKKGGGHDCEIR